VKEELNLDVVAIHPIGNYIFERKNEAMLCYKPWPRATGFAVADWMKARGLPVEFVDFPSIRCSGPAV
jgi:hypothetical protein